MGWDALAPGDAQAHLYPGQSLVGDAELCGGVAVTSEQISFIGNLVLEGRIAAVFHETLAIARAQGDAEALELAMLALRILEERGKAS